MKARAQYEKSSLLKLTVRILIVAILITFSSPQVDVVAQTESNIQAFHRDGQTFITWQEHNPIFTEDLTFAEVDAIIGSNANIQYHIYRHSAPIDATNLGQATRIGEVEIGSGYNRYVYGGKRSSKSDRDIHRYVLNEGQGGWGFGEMPLNRGIFVYSVQPNDAGSFFYAVTVVENGVETLLAGNALSTPIAESYQFPWRPILQNQDVFTHRYSIKPYTGDQYIYTRWEAAPLSSVNSFARTYMVLIPPGAPQPYKVNLNLHAWGGSIIDSNPQAFYPDGMYVTSTDSPPQSWWTGWNEEFFEHGCRNDGTCEGANIYYTMKRMKSFLEWMKTQWPIDDDRVMCSGWSMGGSGAKIFCLRHAEMFSYVNSWVGIGNPQGSSQFLNEYENIFGPVAQGLVGEDGINTWDDLNMAQWLRANPEKETPFITYANGKNDAGIGWGHAVEFYEALRDTKRPYAFTWGQAGHSQKALDMGLSDSSANAGSDRLDFQKNKAVPAFTNFSLDDNPGNGDPLDGDSEGAVNAYQRWDPNTMVDASQRFEIELWLLNETPQATATTDVTLRNVQAFVQQPADSFSWELVENGNILQLGTGVARPGNRNFSDSQENIDCECRRTRQSRHHSTIPAHRIYCQITSGI